ncbi:MAG: hypothetical protein WCN98_07830, partial [Verrucomicrobiaceae bacterium]
GGQNPNLRTGVIHGGRSRPNASYIREMKKFGILPETLDPRDTVDVYSTDEEYWRSFWLTETPLATRKKKDR